MREKYAYTDSLKGVLMREDTDEKSFAVVHQGIEFHIDQYTKLREEHGGVTTAYNYLRNMQEIIDEEVDKQSKTNKPVKCSKGCSFCCHINVDITEDEAELLIAHCAEHGIEIDTDKLKRQADSDNWLTQKPEDRKCVFLGDDGTCKVYENRPSNCRRQMVISQPDLCDTVKYPGGEVMRYLSMEAEMITTAVMTALKTDTMPRMLLYRLSKQSEKDE